MRRFHALPILAAAVLAACSSEPTADGPISPEDAAESLAKAETPRAGQYNATIEVTDFDIPGMPKQQLDQMKSMFTSTTSAGNTYCISEAEAKDGAREMAKKLAEGDCSFNTFEASGNRLVADMVCKNEQGIEGRVKLDGTTTSEGSDMVMELTQKVPGMPGEGAVHMKARLVSKRVGDCPA